LSTSIRPGELAMVLNFTPIMAALCLKKYSKPFTFMGGPKRGGEYSKTEWRLIIHGPPPPENMSACTER
jgi:hypothetical protein